MDVGNNKTIAREPDKVLFGNPKCAGDLRISSPFLLWKAILSHAGKRSRKSIPIINRGHARE
jgi:hypothetical protein